MQGWREEKKNYSSGFISSYSHLKLLSEELGMGQPLCIVYNLQYNPTILLKFLYGLTVILFRREPHPIGQALVTTANVRHILNSSWSSWTITVCFTPQQLFCVMWTCATCTRAPFLWSHTEWHKPNALIQTDTQFPFFFYMHKKS